MFRGIFPSIPTICNNNGEIDEGGQRSVVRYCIEKGASGIACLLFAGEFYKFSDSERRRVASLVIDEANGKVPVLVGISHSGTLPSIQFGKHAKDVGADGVIATPPYHANFVTEASLSLLRHYEKIARQVDLPIMIQDYQTADGVKLSASDLDKIARSSSNIRYVKMEGMDHLKRIEDAIRLTNGRVSVFGGMAGRYLLEELSLGTQGSMPGAELIDLLVSVYDAERKGDAKLARATFRTSLPYLDFLIRHFDSFVAVEKEVLKARGVIRHPAVREPAIPLDKKSAAELWCVIQKIRLENVS